MADMKKCDRCGVVVENSDAYTTNWILVTARNRDEDVWSRYDLCEKCAVEFVDFLTEKRV